MDEEQGGAGPLGAAGMKAKTTSKLPTVNENGQTHDAATKKTHKTKKKDAVDRSCMYDCDVTFSGKRYSAKGTVKKDKHGSSKSVASLANSVAACSINGKSFGGDGSVVHNAAGEPDPVMCQRVKEAIGGSLCMSEVELWEDGSGNYRASLHLVIHPIAVLPPGEAIDIRTSLRNPAEVIFQVLLHVDFTNPDAVLNYILKRMKVSFPHLKTKKQRLQMLRIHPRYMAMVRNIKHLLGKKGNFTFQYRVLIGDPLNSRKPTLAVADCLVLAKEDPLFFGIHKHSNATGTHVHLEFKEKDKKFSPVSYEGDASANPIGNTPPRPSRGRFDFDGSSGHPASVPEEVQVNSPYPPFASASVNDGDDEAYTFVEEESSSDEESDDDDDENSTLSSKSDNKMDVDSSSTSSDEIIAESCLDESGQFSEELLMKQLVAQCYARMQTKPKHTKKKSRTPEGSFDDDSKTSHVTRGTADRDGKRKVPKKPESQAQEELDSATRKSSKSKKSTKSKLSHKSTKSKKAHKKSE